MVRRDSPPIHHPRPSPDGPSHMKEPTCKLVCTGCGLEMPYRDRSLAEQAAELHQLRDPEHVTFIVPPDWSPEEPVKHQ